VLNVSVDYNLYIHILKADLSKSPKTLHVYRSIPVYSLHGCKNKHIKVMCKLKSDWGYTTVCWMSNFYSENHLKWLRYSLQFVEWITCTARIISSDWGYTTVCWTSNLYSDRSLTNWQVTTRSWRSGLTQDISLPCRLRPSPWVVWFLGLGANPPLSSLFPLSPQKPRLCPSPASNSATVTDWLPSNSTWDDYQ